MQILVCPNDDYSEECEIWFKSNFVMSICPISFAIIGWNCSLVFHSVDKVTSFMVHVLPGKIKLLHTYQTKISLLEAGGELLTVYWSSLKTAIFC